MIEYLLDHVETVIAIGGVIVAAIFIKSKKVHAASNDLTIYEVQHTKHRDQITKRTKGVL